MKSRGINKSRRATPTIAPPIISSARPRSSASGDAVLQPFGERAPARAIPVDRLDPPLGPEYIDRPREWVDRDGLANQGCQLLGTFAEVDRLGRYHHPDRARRANHVPAFNARSTAIKVFASAPRPTRTVTPSISTSIVPALASALLSGALRCSTGDDPASTTAGTNCNPSASERPASDTRN